MRHSFGPEAPGEACFLLELAREPVETLGGVATSVYPMGSWGA